MENPHTVRAPGSTTIKGAKQILGYKKLNRRKPLPAQSGIRITKSSVGTRYRAHLLIKGLRFYANTSDHAAAIDRHIIFVQMRDAVAAESSRDPCLWINPEKLLGILNGILADSNTSATTLDLHVFVYMRGTPWLDGDTYVVSPVMQLDQAVPLYARLLRAQCTSWEALRTEWVCLLQLKQKSQTEAETIADQARQKALNLRLRQAELIAKRAMKREELKNKKALAAAEREQQRLEREQRRLAVADAKAKALERRAMKARRQGLNKDMTMADIMGSTAPHL